MKPRRGFVIAGGGTAGHTNPGIAVAQALVARGVPAEDVHFVGGERGNEGELVPAAGFTIDQLPGRGLARSVKPKAIVRNVRALGGTASAMVQAWSILRRRSPRAVLCLGGYAAAPATVAALGLRIPIVVSEQNARASAVNRFASRVAASVAIPYPDTDIEGVLTGNPIRAEFLDATAHTDRAEARAALGLDADRRVVAAWGGSLGASSINRAVADLRRRWSDEGDLAIYHVVGRRDWADYASLANDEGGLDKDNLDKDNLDKDNTAKLQFKAVEYENRMPLVLSASDIAVTRSGASSSAELAVAGLPAVMVPLPGAPRDHQWANAEELVSVGGAIRLQDRDLDGERLAEVLTPLLRDSARLATMAEAAKSVGRPDAADKVAELLLDVGRRSDTTAEGEGRE